MKLSFLNVNVNVTIIYLFPDNNVLTYLIIDAQLTEFE